MLASVSFMLFSTASVNAQAPTDLEDAQQIVAIVNDDLITLYDLKQRALLLRMSAGDRPITPEFEQQLQGQAMDALIDERLKTQEAEKYDAIMSTRDLNDAFKGYAGQFNMSSDELEEQLNLAGIIKGTLTESIRSTMSWGGVITGLLQPQVNVTDDEVNNIIEGLERDRGKDEFRVSEIFLLITDNARREQTIETANAIYQQLQQNAPFGAVAQQLSQSSTAAVGGDLGWVMAGQLPKDVNDVVLSMQEGEMSEPIITEDGVYILKVTDKRQILTPRRRRYRTFH